MQILVRRRLHKLKGASFLTGSECTGPFLMRSSPWVLLCFLLVKIIVVDHRVSFEITAEDVVRCVEKKPTMLMKTGSMSLQDVERNTKREANLAEMSNGQECNGNEPSSEIREGSSADGEDSQRHQKQRSTILGSSKEFNFDNVDGGYPDKATIGSDWWANEKVLVKQGGSSNNWIFPMMQPGVSYLVASLW
ncbi:PREDICTED: uncharacterized protein LOC109231337 [Nicotiana attenuata]|uniref:Uncharacterized protein n=1 Tax=Nicotiana attenuata TaxID=49451 RepID=A0A1J6J7P8_NICAT|nr:PREDICTED: uncharacterized protein LOC109231337 [Nicotiana attenuata]OIT08664.1 hypothetical protein A4A49_38712 [Nicotiana attenuata]